MKCQICKRITFFCSIFDTFTVKSTDKEEVYFSCCIIADSYKHKMTAIDRTNTCSVRCTHFNIIKTIFPCTYFSFTFQFRIKVTHLISSHLISYYLILSHLILSRYHIISISSHLISISCHLDIMSSYIISSYLIISSHLISISSHLISISCHLSRYHVIYCISC